MLFDSIDLDRKSLLVESFVFHRDHETFPEILNDSFPEFFNPMSFTQYTSVEVAMQEENTHRGAGLDDETQRESPMNVSGQGNPNECVLVGASEGALLRLVLAERSFLTGFDPIKDLLDTLKKASVHPITSATTVRAAMQDKTYIGSENWAVIEAHWQTDKYTRWRIAVERRVHEERKK